MQMPQKIIMFINFHIDSDGAKIFTELQVPFGIVLDRTLQTGWLSETKTVGNL